MTRLTLGPSFCLALVFLLGLGMLIGWPNDGVSASPKPRPLVAWMGKGANDVYLQRVELPLDSGFHVTCAIASGRQLYGPSVAISCDWSTPH